MLSNATNQPKSTVELGYVHLLYIQFIAFQFGEKSYGEGSLHDIILPRLGSTPGGSARKD